MSNTASHRLTSDSAAKNKALVFTSAGDEANIHHWLNGNPAFDLHITYYGEQQGKYSELTPHYTARKGGKFPNLLHLYQQHPEFIQQYAAILVMDDDVIISTDEINRLFEVQQQRDLWLLQAAFNRSGKISHRLTCYNPTTYLRFSNFAEMTCPLFRTDKLIQFLNIFDPKLNGFGTDHWYMHSLGDKLQGHVAIIDEVTCLNPKDDSKRHGREINRLQSTAERRKIWATIAQKEGIPFYGQKMKIYSKVKRPLYQQLVYAPLKFILKKTQQLHSK